MRLDMYFSISSSVVLAIVLCSSSYSVSELLLNLLYMGSK